MHIAVLGAAGWVGRAVLENLAVGHQLRAFDRGPEAWEKAGPWEGEIVHGDIASYQDVEQALDGVDSILHAAVHSGGHGPDDEAPFRINLKGLWNTLEVARLKGIKRVVHIGSCQVEHPDGVFFESDVRRPDGSLYAITKRLQEEMCRQFHEAFGLSIIVLRPCSIVDTRLGIGKNGQSLSGYSTGWVCRHDLAQACRLALENTAVDFDIFHTAGPPEAAQACNVERGQQILGLEYKGAYQRFR
ncbi:MAG: NAD-dependent epimerase/dehydratase family protein [Candidatus Latescibacteria bacterium]|nr:NAD-dependent epimerase/dehydratase family protein [Candidatus Latescibacterota bacterium]